MLNLTRQEKQALLFLTCVLLLGLGIDFSLKVNSRGSRLLRLSEDIGKVDLNRADKPTLMSVKGVGERLASRIIAYREENSGFREIEELRAVKGINRAVYEKIKVSLIVK